MLNNTVPSRFNSSTSLSVIVDKLMIENLSKELFYDFYYAKCAPASCTYSVTQRKSTLLIATILLGLLGGLNIALKILTPLIINGVQWWIRNRRSMYASPWNRYELWSLNSRLFDEFSSSSASITFSTCPSQSLLSWTSFIRINIKTRTSINTIISALLNYQHVCSHILLFSILFIQDDHDWQSHTTNVWTTTTNCKHLFFSVSLHSRIDALWKIRSSKHNITWNLFECIHKWCMDWEYFR